MVTAGISLVLVLVLVLVNGDGRYKLVAVGIS